MSRFDLGEEARTFAGQLGELLNRTVCHGISISAVSAGRTTFKVGFDLKSDDFRVSPIPLTIGGKPASGYLGVSYSLSADDVGRYLMVRSSVLTYGCGEDTEHPLLHYDYERDKADGYPDAHLQICAEASDWAAICEKRSLDKRFQALHLPLGNRRFRPTLEDLIGFLIAEDLADARPNHADVLAEGQQRFADLQLRAAIRRNPSVAREAVEALDS